MKSRRGTKVPLGRRSAGRAVLHENLALKFRSVGRLLARYYDAVLEPSGLATAEHGLLLTLRHWQGSRPQSMTHLAGRAGLEDSATRKALHGLAKRRLIKIAKPKALKGALLSPDRRTRLVVLSEKGQRLVDGTEMRLRRAQLDISRMLTLPVLATVYRALQTLQGVLPRHTEAWIQAATGVPPTYKPASQRPRNPRSRYRPLRLTASRPRRVCAVSRRRQRDRLRTLAAHH